MRELAHAEVVDDQQRHGRQIRQQDFAGAVERRVGDLLDEGMGFAVDDAIALLGGGVPNRLREMALAGARRAEKERVFALANEAGRREFVDERAIHLLVEIKIETVERAVRIAEAGLFMAPFKEPVLPPLQFIADEGGDQVERGEFLGLRLAQPCFEDRRHAGEAECAASTSIAGPADVIVAAHRPPNSGLDAG